MDRVTQLFVILTLLVSCSQLQKKIPPKAVTEEQSLEKTMVTAREKLSEITEQAIKNGESAAEYLASNLFLKASQASYSGDYESSALIYEFVLRLQPKDKFIAFKYAVDLIRIGKITNSLEVLEKYYEPKGQMQEKLGMLLAGVYTSYQKPHKARKVYLDVLKNNKMNAEACVFLAKSYADEGKQKQAITRLNKCEKHNKEKGIFAYYRAKFYLNQDKVKMAKKEFRKALKVSPAYYQAALGLGLIHEDAGNMDKAIAVYDKFLDNWANNRVILSRMVQALFATKQFSRVINYAQRLVLLDPTDLNLKVKLGIIYTEKEDYQKAISIFEDVVKEVPDSDKVLYYLAAIHQEVDELEKSMNYYMKIKPESALFIDSSIQISQILSSMAINDRSVEDRFSDFIAKRRKLDEKLDVELAIIQGQYLESTQETYKAIVAIESVSGKKDFTDSQRYYLATLHDKNKTFERSVELVEKIIENDPTNAHAWNFIGYSYLERQVDLDKAFKYISKAVELAPKDGYIRDSMGWYYYKRGEVKKALEELQIAYKLVKDDRIIAKHLGIVHMAVEQYNKARNFFDLALKLSEQETDKNELLIQMQKLDEQVSRRYPASSK